MRVTIPGILLVFTFVLHGCGAHIMQPGEFLVQFYDHPNRFLIIGLPLEAQGTLWRDPFCNQWSPETRLLQLHFGNSIDTLSSFGVTPDSEFTIRQDDTLFTVSRLNGALQRSQADYPCHYLAQRFENQYIFVRVRQIDIYSLHGSIRKIALYLWCE